MYVTWQILLAGFLAVCVGFSSVCAAGGWLIKIIKGLKKPSDDTKEKIETVNKLLDNDNKRIRELEDQLKYISSAIGVLMRCGLVILGHLRTNNNTGQMTKMEKEITDFLVERA